MENPDGLIVQTKVRPAAIQLTDFKFSYCTRQQIENLECRSFTDRLVPEKVPLNINLFFQISEDLLSKEMQLDFHIHHSDNLDPLWRYKIRTNLQNSLGLFTLFFENEYPSELANLILGRYYCFTSISATDNSATVERRWRFWVVNSL